MGIAIQYMQCRSRSRQFNEKQLIMPLVRQVDIVTVSFLVISTSEHHLPIQAKNTLTTHGTALSPLDTQYTMSNPKSLSVSTS